MTMSSDRHERLFDVHPVTGASIEVFWADRTLETFGLNGSSWFWHHRKPGHAPEGPAQGPFPTRYSADRAAFLTTCSQNGLVAVEPRSGRTAACS